MEMLKFQRWWRSLESVPGLAEVTFTWKSLLGPEHELMTKFFRPNGMLAQSVPCQAKRDCGCAHFVVEHAPDHIVAVCQCEPQRCDTFPITRSDMVIYEVNQSALGAALASALGIEYEGEEFKDMYMTFQLGTYSPLAGFEFPVFLTMQNDPNDLQQVAATLIAGSDGPLILLVPTRELCNPAIMDIVQRKGCCLLALDYFMGLGKDGDFVTDPPVETLLAKFKDLHVPTPEDQTAMTFFPTPPGSTWENVRIRFVDGHRVSVKVKSESGVFNYTQMGMASSKNGEPTVQWELLATFADEHGALTWRSPKAAPNLKRRKSTLASNLCDFFRINGDPFIYEETTKGWRARFAIGPD
jgi:hypothetical protein